MKSVCGHDFLYVHTNEVVFDYAICMQLCTGKKHESGRGIRLSALSFIDVACSFQTMPFAGPPQS